MCAPLYLGVGFPRVLGCSIMLRGCNLLPLVAILFSTVGTHWLRRWSWADSRSSLSGASRGSAFIRPPPCLFWPNTHTGGSTWGVELLLPNPGRGWQAPLCSGSGGVPQLTPMAFAPLAHCVSCTWTCSSPRGSVVFPNFPFQFVFEAVISCV